jgi:hypothetical protein
VLNIRSFKIREDKASDKIRDTELNERSCAGNFGKTYNATL